MAELDPRTVVVTNGKTEREIAGSAWNLLRSAKEKGNTRKGWTFVRFAEPKAKKVASVPPTATTPGASTYIPPEVAAAATQAAAEATMLAGETVTPEEVLASGTLGNQPATAAPSEPETPAVPAAPVAAAPAPPAPKPEAPAADVKADVPPAPAGPYEGPKDELQKVKNVGPKTEQVFNSIGVYTYAQLRDVDEKALTVALEANGLGVKKALIPHWKKDAGDILNPPTPE